MNETVKSKRGFASMDPDKQRAIARKGGQASHGAKRASETDAPEQTGDE